PFNSCITNAKNGPAMKRILTSWFTALGAIFLSITAIDLSLAQDLGNGAETSGAQECVLCDLRYRSYLGSELDGSNFRGSYLFNANFEKSSLVGVNFESAIMVLGQFERADLTLTNLRDANLRGANLSGANFSYASLLNANLTGADLTGATLYGNNKKGAKFIDADLSGARIASVITIGTDFCNARMPVNNDNNDGPKFKLGKCSDKSKKLTKSNQPAVQAAPPSDGAAATVTPLDPNQPPSDAPASDPNQSPFGPR
ncbi:MAG: pentapeptide repeat-containing protein, partial [Alphaproteobacteria bacterium]